MQFSSFTAYTARRAIGLSPPEGRRSRLPNRPPRRAALSCLAVAELSKEASQRHGEALPSTLSRVSFTSFP
jgi:hypothetical protein